MECIISYIQIQKHQNSKKKRMKKKIIRNDIWIEIASGLQEASSLHHEWNDECYRFTSLRITYSFTEKKQK